MALAEARPVPPRLMHVDAAERRALDLEGRHPTRHRSSSGRRSPSPGRRSTGVLTWHILGLHRPVDEGPLEGALCIRAIKPVPRPSSPKPTVAVPTPKRRRSESPRPRPPHTGSAHDPKGMPTSESRDAPEPKAAGESHGKVDEAKPKKKRGSRSKAEKEGFKKEDYDEAAMEKVMECFKKFDVDGNGMIERWEFKEVLKRLDETATFTDESIEQLFVAADADKDDKVNFEELVRWIFSGDKNSTEFRSVAMPLSWDERLKRLAAHLGSRAVQVRGPAALEPVDARLSAEEVEKVFVDNVPGVKDFLFRGKSGQYSIKFMKSAYADGLQAFQGTELHNHFLWLLRLVVHNGHDEAPGAAKHLRDVAEAFQDCQAVQARVIERAGLQIQGLSHDFRGLLAELANEYKVMALKVLSYQGCVKLGGPDETKDPAHYENRLLMDIGDEVGFTEADIKRAKLDNHAISRFKALTEKEKQRSIEDFRQAVDAEALLKALMSELNSFSEKSPPESLPRMFLTWASEAMTSKHVLLDEETYINVDVQDALALAVLEVVFFGSVACGWNEEYRGERLRGLFFDAEY